MRGKSRLVKLEKLVFVVLTLALLSCEKDDDSLREKIFNFDFKDDTEGWTAGFADYPEGNDEFYELDFEHSMLPEPLSQQEGALKVAGNNHSDDLFMYVKKKVDGLLPGGEYSVTMTIEFASNVADQTAGVGGSPGESVYIKAGATTVEPDRALDEFDWFRMNIDKANQSQSGEDMIVVGDFSNDTENSIYTLKMVTNEIAFTATADENGGMWLIVGTDSAFEAKTTIYYNQVRFVLTP